MQIRREMPGAVQERDREVDADYLSSAFSESERMPPMTATNVDDVRTPPKLEQIPQAPCFRSNMV